jgi:hypothetical protein
VSTGRPGRVRLDPATNKIASFRKERRIRRGDSIARTRGRMNAAFRHRIQLRGIGFIAAGKPAQWPGARP